MSDDTTDQLTDADRRNGWTESSLAQYRASRESVHSLVAGNVITEFKRPKAQKYLVGAKQFNPHRWK